MLTGVTNATITQENNSERALFKKSLQYLHENLSQRRPAPKLEN